MFGISSNFLQEIETSPYPRCPRHAHHTVTVQGWLHLYLQYSISEMLMSIHRAVRAKIAQTDKETSELRHIAQDRPFENNFDRFLEAMERNDE